MLVATFAPQDSNHCASALIAALVSASVALVAAIITILNSERRIAAENVIQERKIWREAIRQLAKDVRAAFDDEGDSLCKLKSLHAQLTLQLNPHDSMDQAILNLLVSDVAEREEQFTLRIALLLKHDWERAKCESSFWRQLFEHEPCRLAFERFTPGVEHCYRIKRLDALKVFLCGQMRRRADFRGRGDN